MVVPLLALAFLALVVIKSLMRVVAHDDGAPAARTLPTESQPAFSAGDDGRTLLLPAATDHVADPVEGSNVF